MIQILHRINPLPTRSYTLNSQRQQLLVRLARLTTIGVACEKASFLESGCSPRRSATASAMKIAGHWVGFVLLVQQPSGKSRSRGDLPCLVKIGFQYKDLPRLFLRCLGLCKQTDQWSFGLPVSKPRIVGNICFFQRISKLINARQIRALQEKNYVLSISLFLAENQVRITAAT
jgi:hypothetical protein